MDDNKDLQNEFDLPQNEGQSQPPIVPMEQDIAASFSQNTHVDLSPVLRLAQGIHHELGKVIIGQKDIIDFLIVAILSDGHVLLEGVPGIAKTLTAKLLSKSMDMKFSRIQFTPDLMPTDVVGTNVFNMKTAEFNFRPGPIFGNVILVDEINRAPAKTQAAMFEVMEEKQTTIDGVTYPMDLPFFVMATQNPIEQEGTYKLPEAQLDRFLFKLIMKYPSHTEEKSILRRFHNNYFSDPSTNVSPVCTKEDLKRSRDLVEKILIQDNLLDYIADIVHNTRTNGDLFLGASPRASLGILRASKAYAAINGRDFVTPDDIQAVAYPVLNHRIILNPDREMEGYETKDVIDTIFHQIEVPR